MDQLIAPDDFETLLYDERDGVAYVTMNRPEVHNAFNYRMQLELKSVWRSARHNDDVRCIVLTGAGEKAFCTGIDRAEAMGHWTEDPSQAGHAAVPIGGSGDDSPWHFDDPGENIGPKSNDLWKPVIAAVNGMACGGAFYMLGEVEFIIAADHATFFDPHVTYGMTACFESMHMLQKMPFHEIMRIALLGARERMSAQRAHEIGLVSEIVPGADLAASVEWVAQAIASAPAVAVQGTVRSLWAARELSRVQALDVGKILIRVGSDPDALLEGQKSFSSGERIQPRIR
jgi:enoyl-CoA hydratase/carnithine racemase